MKFTIEKTPNGWALDQEDGESRWPTTIKATAREVIARLMQLMEVGPVAPQIEPERVGMGISSDVPHKQAGREEDT